jgi:hypothetical protein
MLHQRGEHFWAAVERGYEHNCGVLEPHLVAGLCTYNTGSVLTHHLF